MKTGLDTGMRYSFQWLMIAALLIISATANSGDANAQTARSRYKFVDTVRKTTTPKYSAQRYSGTENSANQTSQMSPAKQTPYSGPLDRQSRSDQQPTADTANNTAAIPSYDTQQPGNTTDLASYHTRPGNSPEPAPARLKYEESVPAPLQGPASYQEVQNPQASFQSAQFQQPVQSQMLQQQDFFQQPVYNQPMDFQSVDYSYQRNSYSTFFGVHRDECCDEWADFCGCRGGLKANPGHYGREWLRSPKDPCGLNQGGCRIGKKSGRGCKSGSCGSGDCGGSPAPGFESNLTRVRNTGGLFSRTSSAACDCPSCR